MKQAIKTRPQAQAVQPQPQAGITVFVVVPRPSAHLTYNERLGNPYIVRQAEFLKYLDPLDPNTPRGQVKLTGEITRLIFTLDKIHGSRKDAIIEANTKNRHRATVLEDAAKALRKFKAT